MNKHKFNNSYINKENEVKSNIDKVNSFVYTKASKNIKIENNNRIKHYYTKNEKIINNNINKKKNKDIIIKHEKNNSLNYSILPSSSLINISGKSNLLSNSYFFQQYNYNKRNNESNININISNIKRNKSKSNNEINNKINLSKNINKKNPKKDFLKQFIFDESNIYQNNNIEKNIISLEKFFDNEIKLKNIKNPEEVHFFYVKFVQAGKEIAHNFENEEF